MSMDESLAVEISRFSEVHSLHKRSNQSLQHSCLSRSVLQVERIMPLEMQVLPLARPQNS